MMRKNQTLAAVVWTAAIMITITVVIGVILNRNSNITYEPATATDGGALSSEPLISDSVSDDVAPTMADSDGDTVSSQSQSAENAPFSTAVYAQDIEASEVVFVGDSRTEGLSVYGELDGATFVSAKGLNVSTALSKQLITLKDGEKGNVVDALKECSYSRVYISLGINELGWPYPDVFVEKYSALIDQIKKVNPAAVIVVQAILPVTKEKSDDDTVFTNEKIKSQNALIAQMAREKGVLYQDASEAVVDIDGALHPDASTDGIHLNKAYCMRLAEYLKRSW